MVGGGGGGGGGGVGSGGHLLTLHISHYLFCLVSIPGNIPEGPYPPQGEALFTANSHFRVSGPVCIFASCLHTTITHGIKAIGTTEPHVNFNDNQHVRLCRPVCE